jgi:hypothetical protein
MADWFDGNGNGSAVDAAEILSPLVIQGFTELVGAGALVSAGMTSDGGALAFTVTVDGRWRREYFRDAAELATWIGEALPAVHEARGTSRPSSVPRGRTRSRQTR